MNQMKSKLVIALILISNVVLAQGSRTEQWKSDLTSYHQALEQNHIDLYHQIDRAELEKELDTIHDAIEHLSDWAIAARLMKLTRRIGDGHTAVSLANWDTHSFPIGVEKISNQWRLVKVPTDQSKMLGASIETIDGIKISDIEQKLSHVAQYVENSYSEVVRIGSYMPIGELLHALSITNSPKKAVFGLRTIAGKELSLTLPAISKTELEQRKYKFLNVTSEAIVKPQDADFEYLWYSPIKDKNATYIRFDSYPRFEEMVPFAEKLFMYTTQNQSEQLVIDLRHNGGGDLYIGLVLANALNLVDTVNWKNGVYVLTSGVTFSAGASNAALFRQLLNATIVGTPTGSNPTGYQDMGEFVLPNSKLRITYSKRLFRLQETSTNGVVPDILVKPEWNAYAKGVDNVLEEVINRLK